jgi:hypothetical protein
MSFSIWWLIPAFVGLVGILMLVGGVGRVFKAKFASGIFRVLFGGLTLAGAAIIGLVGLNLQTYAQLTKERLAGTVTLKKLDEFKYTATVDLADNGKLRGAPVDYQVTGEDFRVEGPILKFKGWANVIGADSIYRIDHIEGVYVDSDCENRFDPKRQDFAEKGSANDAFRTIRSLGESWKLVNAVDVLNIDARRMPMADGAVYNIKATQQGLELEPGNQIATDQQNTLLSRTGVQCPADPNAPPVATPANPTGAAQVQTTVEPPAQTNAPPAQQTAPATPPSN